MILDNQIESRTAIIIGAGPAGLAAGIALAKCGCAVTVVERNRSAGHKLLLSGQGQCNITHAGNINNFLPHYGGTKKSHFVKPALFNFDNQAVMKFFEDAGVPIWIRDDGKVFPKSLQAKHVLNALLQTLTQAGAKLVTDTTVTGAAKLGNEFSIDTNNGNFRADILVIAAGGRSYPATGSDGSGYKLAESFGHRIVPPKPALTAVEVQNYPFAESAGTSFVAIAIEIIRNGKVLAKNVGDILLTHTGLSGPGILDMSRFIAPNDTIRLQLVVPNQFSPDLYSGQRTVKNAFHSLKLPDGFLSQLFQSLDIDAGTPAAQVPRKDRRELESALTALPFVVKQLGTWHEAMSTAGGVDISEVNRQTMESRIVSGLYFCGEVLDIDGDTGGYNIQFALSSGFKYLAYRS